MKMMLLLSDEKEIVKKRGDDLVQLRQEGSEAQDQAIGRWNELKTYIHKVNNDNNEDP